MSDQNFNARFLEAFRASGLTKTELARRSGVSLDLINKLYARPGSSTSAERAERLMAVLEVPAKNVRMVDWTGDEERLLQMFQRLTDAEKAELLDHMKKRYFPFV